MKSPIKGLVKKKIYFFLLGNQTLPHQHNPVFYPFRTRYFLEFSKNSLSVHRGFGMVFAIRQLILMYFDK